MAVLKPAGAFLPWHASVLSECLYVAEMCYFITAVLPGTARLTSLQAIAAKHRHRLQPLRNASVKAVLEPGERYFLTTPGLCDCGTPLGARLRRSGLHDAENLHQEALRLRAKGWSETKTARWLAQRTAAMRRRDREQEALEAPALSEWAGFIAAMLQSGLTDRVGLLLHFYAGPLSEHIVLQGREEVMFSAAASDTLAGIRQDVLYVWRNAAPLSDRHG